MPKVVINACFGGFGLSVEATREYLRRRGEQAFIYRSDVDTHTHTFTNTRVEEPSDIFMHHVYTQDWGESFKPSKREDGTYFSGRDVRRDDPDLVAVVEELGSERASGRFSALKVVEVPDDVRWEIDEYDGLEHVAESHRTWS